MDVNSIYDKVSKQADQSAVKVSRAKIEQVRFSNNEIDITNHWDVESASVFMAKEGKTFLFDLKREQDLDSILGISASAMNKIEKNNDFVSLNDKKNSYRNKRTRNKKLNDIEAQEFVKNFIHEIKPFIKRVGGVFYKKELEEEVKTPFNSGSDKGFGVEFVARAFNSEDYPVQTSFMTSTDDDLPDLYNQEEEILDLIRKVKNVKDGKDGKYNIIFSPLCFASIVSYTMYMASAFQVDSGMSLFADRLGQKIGNSSFSLYDDPLDDSMIGSRIFDEEGTSVRRTPVIEKGIVKNYLHNFSTSRKYETDTTGNAGIVNPSPWQVSVEPGNEEVSDMISSTKKGLFIQNTWYTRFQDYREGILSTVPRDGIFYIENGEIKESWGGIRISDSLPNIYRNIEGITAETKKVKWWDETLPTKSPYVAVSDVNISKSK